MTITIATSNGKVIEFYNVPHKVGKAIIELLYVYNKRGY